MQLLETRVCAHLGGYFCVRTFRGIFALHTFRVSLVCSWSVLTQDYEVFGMSLARLLGKIPDVEYKWRAHKKQVSPAPVFTR